MSRVVLLAVGFTVGAVAGFVASAELGGWNALFTSPPILSAAPQTELQSTPVETRSIGGSILAGGYERRADGSCAKLKAPGDVVVTDENGQTVGMTRMTWTKGTLVTGPMSGTNPALVRWCQFDFNLPGVPRRAFYSIGIYGQRGVMFSHEEMEARSWTVGIKEAH